MKVNDMPWIDETIWLLADDYDPETGLIVGDKFLFPERPADPEHNLYAFRAWLVEAGNERVRSEYSNVLEIGKLEEIPAVAAAAAPPSPGESTFSSAAPLFLLLAVCAAGVVGVHVRRRRGLKNNK